MNSAPRAVKVSLVVPNYNGGRFLRSCLDSIFAQTYPHLEIIFMDGVSKDDSLSIAQEYAKRYPNLRCVSEPDHGQADAINKGFALATGDYLTWLNSDDRLAPDAIAAAVAALDADPSLALVYGSVINVRENGSFLYLNAGKHWPAAELVYSDFIPQTGAVFRRFPGVEIDMNLFWGFDWELWIQLAKHGQIKCLDHLMGYCIIEGDYERKSNMLTVKRTLEMLRISNRHATRFHGRIMFVYAAVALGYLFWPVKFFYGNYHAMIMKVVGKLSEKVLPEGKGVML